MFKKIAIKIIAKIYHYAIACDRRMYRMYITDKHVFSNMGGGGKFIRENLPL